MAGTWFHLDDVLHFCVTCVTFPCFYISLSCTVFFTWLFTAVIHIVYAIFSRPLNIWGNAKLLMMNCTSMIILILSFMYTVPLIFAIASLPSFVVDLLKVEEVPTRKCHWNRHKNTNINWIMVDRDESWNKGGITKDLVSPTINNDWNERWLLSNVTKRFNVS